MEQALKKQIITVFEPTYLDILSHDMVGFANTSAREMIVMIFIEQDLIPKKDRGAYNHI
jgi:hypothetical protein